MHETPPESVNPSNNSTIESTRTLEPKDGTTPSDEHILVETKNDFIMLSTLMIHIIGN